MDSNLQGHRCRSRRHRRRRGRAGVGNVFGSFLESALRNPAAADGQQGRLFIGFAAAELLGLLAFAVAMILLFYA